jgi:hypothetical protein
LNVSINYCIFSVAGSTNIITKAGIATTAITWGHNTCTSVSSVPATSATLTYAYSAQDFIRANTLRDSTNSAGTANQVLTAGVSGSSLTWTSVTGQFLGALNATPTASAFQNSLVMYNTSTNALTYDSLAYSCIIQVAPATITPTSTMRGRTFIITSTGAQNLTLNTKDRLQNRTEIRCGKQPRVRVALQLAQGRAVR